MIIRRFVTAVREQDWGLAAIDFVIVVAGIFVGLQVDDWNQSRLDRIRESSILPRVLEDMSSTVEALGIWTQRRQYTNQFHLDWINASEDDIGAIASDDLDKRIYEAVWIYTTPFIIHPTLDQLKSTNELQIIKSGDAQFAITELYRLRERLDENVTERNRIMTNLVDPFLIEHYPAQQYMSNLSELTIFDGAEMEVGILPPSTPEDMRPLLLDRKFKNLMAYRLVADNLVQNDVDDILEIQVELRRAIEKRQKELGNPSTSTEQ